MSSIQGVQGTSAAAMAAADAKRLTATRAVSVPPESATQEARVQMDQEDGHSWAQPQAAGDFQAEAAAVSPAVAGRIDLTA